MKERFHKASCTKTKTINMLDHSAMKWNIEKWARIAKVSRKTRKNFCWGTGRGRWKEERRRGRLG